MLLSATKPRVPSTQLPSWDIVLLMLVYFWGTEIVALNVIFKNIKKKDFPVLFFGKYPKVSYFATGSIHFINYHPSRHPCQPTLPVSRLSTNVLLMLP
jgi:hypothetical protein